jgi:acetyl-CoA C-acetyltransferase
VREGGVITAGNASPAVRRRVSAAVMMSATMAASKRGLKPLGIFRGFNVSAGCEPDEMGIGPGVRGAAPAASATA